MILKKFAFIFCIIFCFFNAQAQEWQIQVFGGDMNYGGDLQAKAYTFQQSHLTIGGNLLFRYKHFALRAGAALGHVSGQDGETTTNANRNLSFNSDIKELNGVFEYHILSDEEHKIIPYAFIGAAVYHYSPYTYYDSKKVFLQPLGTEGEGLPKYFFRKMYNLTDLAGVYGLGFRYKISPNFLIGLEYNARFLRTDYLDDVSKTYPDEQALFNGRGQKAVDLSYRGKLATFPSGAQRGNPNQNDNYYSTIITLTYVFNRKENSVFNYGVGSPRRSLKALFCPKKVH